MSPSYTAQLSHPPAHPHKHGREWEPETHRRSAVQGFVIYDHREGELPDSQELNTMAKAAEGEGKQAVFIHEDLTALNAKLKGGRAAVEENEIPGLSRATPTTQGLLAGQHQEAANGAADLR